MINHGVVLVSSVPNVARSASGNAPSNSSDEGKEDMFASSLSTQDTLISQDILRAKRYVTLLIDRADAARLDGMRYTAVV